MGRRKLTAAEFDKLYGEVLHDMHAALMHGNFQTCSNTPPPTITKQDVDDMKNWFKKKEREKKTITGGFVLPPALPYPPANLGWLSSPAAVDSVIQLAITDTLISFITGHTDYEFQQLVRNSVPDIDREDVVRLKSLILQDQEKEIRTWQDVVSLADRMLSLEYPDPVMNIVSSFNGTTMQQKDYYLPGLKVLHVDSDGAYWSPVYPALWENDEMLGKHDTLGSSEWSPENKAYLYACGLYHLVEGTEERSLCDCGIYASVNLEELREYYHAPQGGGSFTFSMDRRFTPDQRRLCIIEPTADSDTYLARKGWKTDHAFLSEVIGETISAKDASELLSVVWNRKLDVNQVLQKA